MMSNHQAYYRRMGSMEEHLGGNAMSLASLSYQLRDLWRNPRGTVLRIEALALIAIILSFFLAFFGSCRRWSNRWIVQKGFLVAQVLSLSLGTYSIGLMQSSPVKSDMYPIWAVSLLTLFGCVDPVATNTELDYKGPISKMIFQLCLYFGYVMLMGVSTISSGVGKLAIILLSTITFFKGFHRALALVLPGKVREVMTQQEQLYRSELDVLKGADYMKLIVHLDHLSVTIADIKEPKGSTANGIMMKDVCLSYSFSHLLRKRFLGVDTAPEMKDKSWNLRFLNTCLECQRKRTIDCQHTRNRIDYEQALNVVEVELAFLFEAFFTSNEFLHLYQAKIGSFWVLASFFGICFLGAVVAINPGAMAGHHNIINSAAAATGTGAGTSNIVVTTTADLIVTLVILVSLALLQLVHLMRCWTSNWARVGIACKYAIKQAKKQMKEVTGGDGPNDGANKEELCSSSNNQIISRWVKELNNQIISQWVMELRLFLVNRVNWFDKYLWQDRLGQDSLDALEQRRKHRESVLQKDCGQCSGICHRCLAVVGVDYFWRLVSALLSNTTNTRGAVKVDHDVKASIAEFLGKINSRTIGMEWLKPFLTSQLQDNDCLVVLPTFDWMSSHFGHVESSIFTRNVMVCHIATCYCEEAEVDNRGGRGEDSNREKNRRVAMHLSKYCVYLVVSAPELLPGPASLDKLLEDIGDIRAWGKYVGKVLCNEAARMPARFPVPTPPGSRDASPERSDGEQGEQSTQRRCSTDPWELLALLWVQTLLYAAPSANLQAHMQHLAQGGEFITHLWALLYHMGIDKWEYEDEDKLYDTLDAEQTTTEAQVEEDAGSGSEIEKINQ